MDGHIVQSLTEKHLGNILGPKCNSTIITEKVTDLYVKVNMVFSHFMHAHLHIRYKLFQCYCISLYGRQLWDFQSKVMKTFYALHSGLQRYQSATCVCVSDLLLWSRSNVSNNISIVCKHLV